MKNLVKVKRVIEYIPGNNVVVNAGDVVVVGQFAGIASTSITGDGSTSIEVWCEGTYDLPKDGNAYSQGDKAYWDATNKVVTNTSNTGANKVIGALDQAQLAGDATARVQLMLPIA